MQNTEYIKHHINRTMEILMIGLRLPDENTEQKQAIFGVALTLLEYLGKNIEKVEKEGVG